MISGRLQPPLIFESGKWIKNDQTTRLFQSLAATST